MRVQVSAYKKVEEKNVELHILQQARKMILVQLKADRSFPEVVEVVWVACMCCTTESMLSSVARNIPVWCCTHHQSLRS